MGRILSIDYGLKRIGLALSDPDRVFAFPLQSITNKGFKEILVSIRNVVEDKEIDLIIIGVPYCQRAEIRESEDQRSAAREASEPRPQSGREIRDQIDNFINKLKKEINISIESVDERLSSFAAEENLKEAGLSSRQYKKYVDMEAARLLLMDYLEKSKEKKLIHDCPIKTEKLRLYLGYAPGKTTALNGVALRALGAGLKVKIILFSKCSETTSESKIYELLRVQFPNHFNYFFAGTSRIREDGSFRFFGDPDGWNLQDQLKLEQGLRHLVKDISSGQYDLLCIDELTDLLYHKEQRVSEKKAKLIFESIHSNTSVLITGHLCPDWLKDIASTVIEGKALKHYKGYTKGIEW